MTLTIALEEKPIGVFTLHPKGSIDTNTYTILEEKVDSILQNARTIVFDMKDVDYMTSAGVHVIFKARRALRKRGGEVVLMNLQPPIKKVFEIIHALPSIPVFTSIEELDEYLDLMREHKVIDWEPNIPNRGGTTLTITLKEKPTGVFTLHPKGSIDTSTYTILEEKVDSILQSAPSRKIMIVFDMQEVDYITSAGVRVIFKARRALRERGGEVALMNLQPQIKKVFEIIHALPSMKVFTSIEELDRYLDWWQHKVIGKSD